MRRVVSNMGKTTAENAMLTHEMAPTSLCLALVGGYLDSFTYLTKGGVFANAQTGNIVLLGIAAAEGDFLAAARTFAPIAAFVAGVLLTELFKRRATVFKWQRAVLAIEAALLVLIGIITLPDFAVNVIISLVCAVQVNSFRTTNGLSFASTMCTGNLRSGTEKLAEFIEKRSLASLRQSLRYFSVILVFIVGALFGGLLSPRLGDSSMFLCAAVLAVVLIYDFIYEKFTEKKAVSGE